MMHASAGPRPVADPRGSATALPHPRRPLTSQSSNYRPTMLLARSKKP